MPRSANLRQCVKNSTSKLERHRSIVEQGYNNKNTCTGTGSGHEFATAHTSIDNSNTHRLVLTDYDVLNEETDISESIVGSYLCDTSQPL